ncbi:MAG: hypothetical protein N2376_03630, partial [Clostridia bacterium]|nr:hypothetical protein [Clostridia bacterium]
YKVTKGKKVFLYWYDKLVNTLAGKESGHFFERIEGVDEKEAQLIMTKATGNFKRDNEKGR